MTQDLVTQDFDYSLPEQLIAQVPTAIRDDSRLLVLDRKSGCVEHRRFRDIGELTRPGDPERAEAQLRARGERA